MPGYIRKFNIIVIIVVLASLAFVLAVPRSTQAYRLFEKVNGKEYISSSELAGIEPSVIQDAREQSEKLYGKSTSSADDYFYQLIGIYRHCLEIDTLIVFNAGGFGWDSVSDAQGWITVMEGIEQFLTDCGENILVVDFERTRSSIEGVLSEAMAFWGAFPDKAGELANRISFLTRNLPGLKVLLSGESNGATIVEETFRLLHDNPRVFSLQTGPTVVQKSMKHERSLVLRHNGKIADSFSQGDVFTILRSNLEAMVGIYQDNPGDILFYIGAPGHYYTWEYDCLRQNITNFLSRHFG